METYLDTSALISMMLGEPERDAIIAMLRAGGRPYVSRLVEGEAVAACVRHHRGGLWDDELYAEHLATLDEWFHKVAITLPILDEDVAFAARAMRRPDVLLRMPDAIHIAVAHRHRLALITRDRGMALAAATLGLAVLTPTA